MIYSYVILSCCTELNMIINLKTRKEIQLKERNDNFP